ncbi:hypothetical protein LCGC14_1078330 [marine sediment metagenome]|uniref:Uncharacterized protein n=1 Tax=marine sediment metagenome TaxID=412755 RepID=A0A0F9N3M8_9ZZZZ
MANDEPAIETTRLHLARLALSQLVKIRGVTSGALLGNTHACTRLHACLTALEADAATASYFEKKDLDLLDLIDWMRQTVHRAYHDGPLNECRRSVCHAALDALVCDGRSRLSAKDEE